MAKNGLIEAVRGQANFLLRKQNADDKAKGVQLSSLAEALAGLGVKTIRDVYRLEMPKESGEQADASS